SSCRAAVIRNGLGDRKPWHAQKNACLWTLTVGTVPQKVPLLNQASPCHLPAALAPVPAPSYTLRSGNKGKDVSGKRGGKTCESMSAGTELRWRSDFLC